MDNKPWDGNGKQHPEWMKEAMHDLARLDKQTFETIADNKQQIINTTVDEAMKRPDIQRLINEVGRTEALVGYIALRRMALVFDMFMALAED